jgi:alkylation response protein AidB-like acyl-CoA dehydrogenase
MRFLPTTEQLALADAVREALVKECSPAVLRRSTDPMQRRRVRAAIAGLGIGGMTVDERFGGLGLDQRDAVGVLHETGRAAAPGPIAETFAVAQVLQAAPDTKAAQAWLPRIATGEAVASVGLGPAPLVAWADDADLLVLQAGSALHAVPTADVGLVENRSIDPTRRVFTVEWQPGSASLIADGADIVGVLRDHVLLGVAAQLTGLAGHILDLSVKHVTTREQFGRPLGVFQAVQHRLADVAVAVDFAIPVVARAACSLAERAPSSERDTAMAKVFASNAAECAAYAGLQLHGAIGYTQEHDFHLYALRAWVLALAYGDAHRHRARVADDLLGAAPAARFPLS